MLCLIQKCGTHEPLHAHGRDATQRNCLYKKTNSKVSALVYLLHKAAVDSTFENEYAQCCARTLTAVQSEFSLSLSLSLSLSHTHTHTHTRRFRGRNGLLVCILKTQIEGTFENVCAQCCARALTAVRSESFPMGAVDGRTAPEGRGHLPASFGITMCQKRPTTKKRGLLHKNFSQRRPALKFCQGPLSLCQALQAINHLCTCTHMYVC
jgi:hypothetical protein